MKHQSNGLLHRGILVLFLALLPWVANASPSGLQIVRAAGQCTGGNCIYLPAILGPRITGDLLVSHVEVTQAIQKPDNSVPLVAGKDTMLRIYAHVADSDQPVPNVDVQVTAATPGGKLLASSPFQYKSTLPLANNRAQYASTINVRLPAQWTSGTVDLTVRIDPKNLVPEANEANNELHLQIVFQKVPPLLVKVVPVQYTHTPSGQTFPAPTNDTVTDWMQRIVPVGEIDLSWHAPLVFSGDLSKVEDWGRLLTQIAALRSSEGGSAAEIYYGFIPVRSGASAWMTGSGIGGAGWIGTRISAGLDLPGVYSTSAANIATHEIGHNLGLAHAPCGASYSDAAYPYRGASIGNVGLDVVEEKIYLPDDSRDLMSYCHPRWISDYSYKLMLQDQLENGAPRAPLFTSTVRNSKDVSQARSLLVRAEVRPDGASFLPLYALPGQAAPEAESGDYRLVLADAQGVELARSAVPAYTVSLDAPASAMVNAVVNLPANAALVQLYQGETLLAETPLDLKRAEPLEFTAEETETQLTLRWQTPRPVIVRSTSNGGASWTTLAVDAQDGLLTIDRATLPQGVEMEVVPAASAAP